MLDTSTPSSKVKVSSYYSSRYESVRVSHDMTPENSGDTTFDVLRYQRESDILAPAAHRAAGGSGGQNIALAPLTKSVDKITEVIDKKTGEYLRVTNDSGSLELRIIRDEKDVSSQARIERFTLQRTARDILSWHPRHRKIVNAKRALTAVSSHSFPKPPWRFTCRSPFHTPLRFTFHSFPKLPWRVTWCNWRALEDPSIWLSTENLKAHFKGLAVCGSVWTCPVCAAKISNFRASEIKSACDLHHKNGGYLVMMTLTFSHSRHDDLKDLIGDSKRSKGFRAALKYFRQSRSYRNFKDTSGLIGLIRNLEVTYGDSNGWHPHSHELLFLPYHFTDRSLSRLKSSLFPAWKSACKKAGLSPPNQKRGIHLIGVISPSEYMVKTGYEQKWGVSAEMTKSHIKRGRFNSMTPFDLLRCASEGGPRSGEAKTRFVQFAFAFLGARQCYWTPGLKSFFNIQDITDEQAAKIESEKSLRVSLMSKATWKRVLRSKYDCRGLLLRIAETGGDPAVTRFLDSLL